MTTWLERREKVLRHDKFLRRQISGSDSDPPISRPPFLVQPRELKMAKHPSARGVSLESLKTDYGASYFGCSRSTCCPVPKSRIHENFKLNGQHQTFTSPSKS